MSVLLTLGKRPFRGFILLLLPLLGATAGLIFLAESAGATPKTIAPLSDNVIGHINGEPISVAQFESEFRLQQVRQQLTGRDDEPIDRPALLNRIIADTLLLQAATADGMAVEDAAVAAEADRILRRFGLSQAEVTAQLRAHGLAWEDFARSIHDYLLLSRFVDESILTGTINVRQSEQINAWLAGQYQRADMTFDEAYLTQINGPAGSGDFSGVLIEPGN